MRIFLVSNMYPSKTDPLFGVFVKNSREELEKQGVVFSECALIKGKTNSKVRKTINYLNHYFAIAKFFFQRNYDLMYVHYLSHHIPILSFLLFFKKKPIVINVHGSDIISIRDKTILYKLSVKILKTTDLLVVPTSYFKELIQEKYPFITEEQLFISPSGGIDNSVFYVKKTTFQTKF